MTQTEVRLVFRKPPQLGFADHAHPGPEPNQLVMQLDPTTGVRIVLVEQIPMAERDFTGGEASALWADLRRIGEVAGTAEELASRVR